MTLVDADETEVIGEAHWTVFLPTVFFAVLFLGLWALMYMLDRGATLPARFAFLVAALVTPLLLLLAFLRYQTARISRSFDGLWVELGWPNMTPRHVAFDEIEGIDVTPSALDLGAGDLTLRLNSGETLRIRSLAAVGRVADRIKPPPQAQTGQ